MSPIRRFLVTVLSQMHTNGAYPVSNKVRSHAFGPVAAQWCAAAALRVAPDVSRPGPDLRRCAGWVAGCQRLRLISWRRGGS